MSGRTFGDRVEVQQDAGQHLADLVVEITRDADAFGFLCGEDTASALLAFALEPVEHSIEGDDDTADLILAKDLQTLARAEKVDGLHSLCQALKRRQRSAQEVGIRGQRPYQPQDDDQRLYRLDRSIDLDGAE